MVRMSLGIFFDCDFLNIFGLLDKGQRCSFLVLEFINIFSLYFELGRDEWFFTVVLSLFFSNSVFHILTHHPHHTAHIEWLYHITYMWHPYRYNVKRNELALKRFGTDHLGNIELSPFGCELDWWTWLVRWVVPLSIDMTQWNFDQEL